jgi:hypothetical protein
MAAASVRPIPCMFNTQQELDLKYVYEPSLHQRQSQNTFFSCSLTPIYAGLLLLACCGIANACGFQDNGDGTLIDPISGIQIRRCAEGQRWSGSVCVGKEMQINWDEAVQRFGKGVWRLLTKNEAAQIVKQSKNCGLAYTWTSSPSVRNDAWVVSFDNDNYLWEGGRSSDGPVRLARISQSVGGVTAAVTTTQDNKTNLHNGQSAQQQSQQAQQQAQQARAAQQQSQQAVFNSAQNQTAADQTRKSERRRHEPENEASHCIQPDFGGLYGGMKNTCDFKVWYTYCGFRPKESSWLTGMSCEKQSFGSDSVSPGRTSASHTKGVESIHWIACKEPAWALDAEFVPGQGIKGRCYTVGGK